MKNERFPGGDGELSPNLDESFIVSQQNKNRNKTRCPKMNFASREVEVCAAPRVPVLLCSPWAAPPPWQLSAVPLALFSLFQRPQFEAVWSRAPWGESRAESPSVIQCLLSKFSLIYDIQIPKEKKKIKRIPHTYEISAFSSNTMEITARLTAHWSSLSEGNREWACANHSTNRTELSCITYIIDTRSKN